MDYFVEYLINRYKLAWHKKCNYKQNQRLFNDLSTVSWEPYICSTFSHVEFPYNFLFLIPLKEGPISYKSFQLQDRIRTMLLLTPSDNDCCLVNSKIKVLSVVDWWNKQKSRNESCTWRLRTYCQGSSRQR